MREIGQLLIFLLLRSLVAELSVAQLFFFFSHPLSESFRFHVGVHNSALAAGTHFRFRPRRRQRARLCLFLYAPALYGPA